MVSCEDNNNKLFAKEYLNRVCRICRESLAPHPTRSPVYKKTSSSPLLSPLGGTSVRKGTEYELIAPCRCSGTMRWVHRMCLDAWRTACYKTEAYYRCEQCQTDYILEAGFGNSILQNKKLLHLLTTLCLAGWVTCVGIAFEFGLNLFYRSTNGEPFLGEEFWVIRGGSLFNLMYNNSYYVNPYLQEVLHESSSKIRTEKPKTKPEQSKNPPNSIPKHAFDDIYRIALNALIVTSFIEWMFINPSMFPAIIAFILAFRYTLHWSLWDKWSLGFRAGI